MKQIINSLNAPAPIGPYNQAILVDGVLYVSGQIAIDPKTNELVLNSIEEEAHLVMKNILAVLSEVGYSTQNIVKATIFLSNMSLFSKVNEVYGSYFETDYPARETVAVAGLPKGVNVEISVIAHSN